VLDKLRRGLFSVQAHLDLHGLTVVEAEEAVREFITEAMTLRYRCVLLVHGRGLNSKDQIPVLKKRLEKILLRGPTRKKILAFTTARPHDGGGGASYVLLRAKN
jgi:DNA-nicking Smr family endonuclease